MRPIRQSVTRLQRRGYTTRVLRHSDLGRADFDTLSADAASWRGDGGDERGFSMALGRLADPLDGDCVLVEAHDADGRLRGFLSFSPWGRNGLSLDLMRRDPTADNGLVELMVASLAERSAQFGVGSGVDELRRLPRGVRARRRDRRRTDRQGVASGPAAGQPQLAARVALPVQREVPAELAAALHVLRVRLRPAPGRHGRRQRRGLPDPTEPELAAEPQGVRRPRRPGDGDGGVRRRGARPDAAGARPAGRGAVGGEAARAGAGAPRQGRPAEGPRHRAVPGRLPAHPHPRPGTGGGRSAGPGRPHRGDGRRSPVGCC